MEQTAQVYDFAVEGLSWREENLGFRVLGWPLKTIENVSMYGPLLKPLGKVKNPRGLPRVQGLGFRLCYTERVSIVGVVSLSHNMAPKYLGYQTWDQFAKL